MASIRIGSWHFVPAARELRSGEAICRLTDLESDLLGYLCEHPGQIVSSAELLREVWAYAPQVQSRAVTHTVARLRKKLESEGWRLSTVYGKGYTIELPDEGDLVGRRDQVAKTREMLDEHRVVTLYGIGGVGKTSIARTVARSRETLWLPMAALADQDDVLAALSAMVAPAEGRIGADRIGAVLERAGFALVVLDGAERLDSWLWTWSREWTEGRAFRILLTARTLPEGERGLLIEPLEADAAKELFLRRSREVRPDEELPADDVARLVQLVSGLPLALELAAGRLRLVELASLEAVLSKDLAVLGGKDQHLDAILHTTWHGLGELARQVLGAAVMFSGLSSLDDLGAVSGLGLPPLLDSLDELTRAALIEVDKERRFGVLDVIRTFVGPRSDTETLRRFVGRMVARADAERERASTDPVGYMSAIASCVSDLRAALVHAEGAAAAQLALVLQSYDAQFGDPQRTRDVLFGVDLEDLPRSLAIDVLQARSELCLRVSERPLRVQIAAQASELARTHGSGTQRVYAGARHVHAILIDQGAHAALELANGLRRRLDEERDVPGHNRAFAQMVIADVYARVGHLDDALALDELAVEGLSAGSPSWFSAVARYAMLQRELGQTDLGLPLLRDAFGRALELGVPRLITESGLELAACALELDLPELARQTLDRTQPAIDELRREYQSMTSRLLRALLLEGGAAIEALVTLAEEAQGLGRRLMAGRSWQEAGHHHHRAGRLVEARACYERSIAILEGTDWDRERAISYALLALVQQGQGDLVGSSSTLAAAGAPAGLAGQIVRSVRYAVADVTAPQHRMSGPVSVRVERTLTLCRGLRSAEE